MVHSLLAPLVLAAALAAEEPAAAAGPAEFTADLIILKTDLAIEGKIIERDENYIVVLVEYGKIRLRREDVKTVEFNLASRLRELAPDDHAGRYKLAAWALEEGMTDDALQILQPLVGKKGVPNEIYRKLARIHEARREEAKALEYWKRLLMAVPGDKEAGARVAELKGSEGAGRPAAGPKEGLEVTGSWSILNWGNPAEVSQHTLVDNNKVLMVNVPSGGGKDKAAVGSAVKLDFAGKEKLLFSVFNGEKSPVELAVAIITAKDYYESRPVRIRPDWNLDVALDLKRSDFKCRATDWKFQAAVEGLDSVRQILYLVYSGRRKALLYFDDIRAE